MRNKVVENNRRIPERIPYEFLFTWYMYTNYLKKKKLN